MQVTNGIDRALAWALLNRVFGVSAEVAHRLRSLVSADTRYRLYLKSADARELYWVLSIGDSAVFLM